MSIIGDSNQNGNAEPQRERVIQLDPPPRFRVQLDGREQTFMVNDLETIEADQLRQQCLNAASCVFGVEQILDVNNDRRHTLVRFLAEVQRSRASTGFIIRPGQQHNDLFEAAHDLLQYCPGVTQVQRCAQLAIEVIGLTASNEAGVRVACGQVIERLRACGVRDVRASQLVSDAMAFGVRGSAPADERIEYVLDVWDDAPCVPELIVPSGWSLHQTEVFSLSNQDAFQCPVLITRLLEDIEGGVFSTELTWKRGARWLHRVYPREQISSTRKIVELANDGVPVNSNNAAILIDYLSDFERENLEYLPTSRVAHRLGWFGVERQEVFLCGNQLIGPNQGGELTTAGAVEQLSFHGEDEGDCQIAAGIRQAGTIQGWVDAVSPLQHFPRALFGLYAALASPLLNIVGAPNVIVSFDGRTSLGKTTVLTVAASCWGYPVLNGQNGESAIFGWDATRVFIERAAAILTGLPLILDDTKVARDKRDITTTVYQFANGAGRGRGSQRGLAATRSWRSVLLSSGEEPLTSFTPDGGSRARVLGLWGSPFPESQDAGQITVQMREALEQDYGVAGPALVQYLANNRNLWGEWREWYRESRQRFQQMASSNAVAGRMAACFAVLELAAYLAHRAIEFPWEYQNTIPSLWAEITADTDEADPALAALRYIIAWCDSRINDFEDMSSPGQHPNTGWLGRYRCRGRDGIECLAIYDFKLDDALNERGCSPAAVRKMWKDNDWLKTEENKTTIRVTVAGRKSPVVAIRWSAIEAVMEGSEACSLTSGRPVSGGNLQGPPGSQ